MTPKKTILTHGECERWSVFLEISIDAVAEVIKIILAVPGMPTSDSWPPASKIRFSGRKVGANPNRRFPGGAGHWSGTV